MRTGLNDGLSAESVRIAHASRRQPSKFEKIAGMSCYATPAPACFSIGGVAERDSVTLHLPPFSTGGVT